MYDLVYISPSEAHAGNEHPASQEGQEQKQTEYIWSGNIFEKYLNLEKDEKFEFR